MAAILSFEQRSETAEIYTRAACKNSVDAVSKPSFYFLLLPAFVIVVVILVPV